MKLSQSRAVCAHLLWRQYQQELYVDAQNKLMRNLIVCSPKVLAEDLGVFLLDASGLKHLGGESKLCRDVLKLASRAGFVNGNVGIADSAFAAMVASRASRVRWHIVPAGGNANFLGPLSIKHLPLEPDALETFFALGIKTMHQLLNLPVEAVSERFGTEGVRAYELAQGSNHLMPILLPQERQFHCSAEAGVPIQSLEHVIFVLKSMLDRLLSLLQQEGLQAEELLLSFYSNQERFAERRVKLIRSSNQTKFLLELIRLALEAEPVEREFTGLALEVSKFSKERWEQRSVPVKTRGGQLAISTGDTAELSDSLALLLQRFKSRLGDNAVLRPVANDQYLPENSGLWLPVLEDETKYQVLPVNTEYLKRTTIPGSFGSGLVLRRASPHIPVLVELKGTLPLAVCYHGQWHKIKEITMPERISGLWWASATKRSYYVALTTADEESHLCLILLVYDHLEHAWFIEGFFD